MKSLSIGLLDSVYQEAKKLQHEKDKNEAYKIPRKCEGNIACQIKGISYEYRQKGKDVNLLWFDLR